MLAADDLKRLADERVRDAEALLAAKRPDGGLYLCGYAVECGLKFRICKTLGWAEFPEENQKYRSFLTHDLETLLHLSGREAVIRSNRATEWLIVLELWDPTIRYRPIGHTNETILEMMIACVKDLLADLL